MGFPLSHLKNLGTSSFVPQGLDRVQTRSTKCRHHTAHQTHGAKDQSRRNQCPRSNKVSLCNICRLYIEVCIFLFLNVRYRTNALKQILAAGQWGYLTLGGGVE